MECPNSLMIQPNSEARSRLRQRMRKVARPVITGRLTGDKPHSEETKQSTADEVIKILNQKFVVDDDLDSILQLAKLMNELSNTVKCMPRNMLTADVGDALISRLVRLIHHPESAIRAAVFCLLKKAILTPAHVVALLLENVDYAVLRGLDNPDTPQEQQQAYRLASRMLLVYCNSKLYKDNLIFSQFPQNIIKSVSALAVSALSASTNTTDKENEAPQPSKKLVEKLAFPALSILNDFAIAHPDRVLGISGTDWLVKCIIGEGSTVTIATIATQIFLKLMDSAKLRANGQLRLVLQQLFSPIGDLVFFYQNPMTPDGNPAPIQSKMVAMMETFATVFLTILRSWAGIFACSAIDPKTNKIYADSPFLMLRFVGTAAITIPSMSQIRSIVVKLCCQLIDAPYAEKNFHSWEAAMEFYSVMNLPDEFKTNLRDDFVVGEMDCLIAEGTLFPDIVDCLMSFRATACAIMLNAGLTEALIRIILADTEDEKSLIATLLLADLMRTGAAFLPRDIRQTLQSVPSLVQAAFERADLDLQSPHDFHMTFQNSKSASLLLRRLDQVNDIHFGREPLKSSLHNIQLFLYGGREPEFVDTSFGNRSRAGSTMDVEARFSCIIAADNGEYFGKTPLTELSLLKLISIVESLEAENGALFLRHKHSEKLDIFCSKMFTILYPSNGYFVSTNNFSPETIKYIGRFVQVIVLHLKDKPDYHELVKTFIVECAKQLLPDELYKGTFSAKNILNTNGHYYFVIIAAIGASTEGAELLESAGIFQIFQELLSGSLSVEYVKLILSSLNYTNIGSVQRSLLETALTSTDEPSRKWCTRFLGVLAGNDALIKDFGTYGMQLLIRQLGDQSAKVVRHALRVLNQWLPKYPEALPLIHHSVLEPLNAGGVLLRAHTFGAEKIVIEHGYETKKEITLWLNTICEEYVAVIEEDMRGALLSVKKCIKGTYARPSNEKSNRYGVPMPVHLFGALARHATGRVALLEEKVPKKLLSILKNTNVENDADCAKVKGALLALGHIIGAVEAGTLAQLVSGEAVAMLVKFAETCPTLSVRGTAIWALNLVGASSDGVRALAKLGWESNRHTQVVDEVVEVFCDETQLLRSSSGLGGLCRSTRANKTWSNNWKYKMPLKKSCSTTSLTKLGDSLRPRIFSDSYMTFRVLHKTSTILKKPLTTTNFVPPDLSVRSNRAATHETSATSGIGSAPVEDTTVLSAFGAKSFDHLKCFSRYSPASALHNLVPNSSAFFGTLLLPEFKHLDFDNKFFVDRIAEVTDSRSSIIESFETLFDERLLLSVDTQTFESVEFDQNPHYSDAERSKYGLTLVRPFITLRVPDRRDVDVIYSFLNLSDLINMQNYHRILYEAGNWQGSTAPCSYERKAGSFAYWTIVSLPVRGELLCQNVFSEENEPPCTKKQISILNKCPKCRRDGFKGFPVSHASKVRSKLRSDILQLVGMVEFRGASLHRFLHQHYPLEEIQQAFSDPCLYVDAIEVLTFLRFDAKFRLEIHKLFNAAVKSL